LDAGEQYMVDFRATVAQPLTKLEAIRELNEVRGLEVEIVRNQAEQSGVEVALATREGSLQLLKIRSAISMLEETVTEVQSRQAQVEAFRQAELVGQEQVLEVAVKLAEMRQTLIKTQALEVVAEARLASLLRLEPGTALTIAEPEALPELPDIESCVSRAVTARQELSEVRLRAEQAEVGVRAKIQEFVPDISLVATYQYQAGSSFGQPELALGAVMSWTPFAWGETVHEVRAAKATARRARLAGDRVAELVALDVLRAHAEARAAFDAIAVVEVSEGQAQELLRIEQARFDVRENTATDLLAAQTSLLRARSTLRAAHYDYHLALAALRRAMGEP